MHYENLKCLLTVAKRGEKKPKKPTRKKPSAVITQDTNIALKCEVHTSFHEDDKGDHSNIKKIFPSKIFVELTRDPQQCFFSLAL